MVHLASLHICKWVHGCACGFLVAISNTVALQILMRVQGFLAAESFARLGFVQAHAPTGWVGGVAHVFGGVVLQGQASTTTPLQQSKNTRSSSGL